MGKPDIAIKQFKCHRRRDEVQARHELYALRRVAKKGLEACMPGGDAYVQLDTSDGGVRYNLTMPCARRSLLLVAQN